MKNKYRIISLLWILLMVVFDEFTEYLIECGLSTNTKALLIALGWLSLGWFGFWIDYKFRLSKKDIKQKKSK